MFSPICLLFVSSLIRSLFVSYSLLGTPDESIWEGVSSLPHYRTSFPNWYRKRLSVISRLLDEPALDLLDVSQILQTPPFLILHSSLPHQKIFQHDPSKRISSSSAMKHLYCSSLPTHTTTSHPPTYKPLLPPQQWGDNNEETGAPLPEGVQKPHRDELEHCPLQRVGRRGREAEEDVPLERRTRSGKPFGQSCLIEPVCSKRQRKQDS
jgi:serine/threonine protein kinase